MKNVLQNYFSTARDFQLKGPGFFSKIKEINSHILQMSQASLTQTLLFSNSEFTTSTNWFISNETVDFLLLTKRFNEAIM